MVPASSILTDALTVQYGLTSSVQWSAQLDDAARFALANMVRVGYGVYALDDWGRVDGWAETKPVALLLGNRLHVDQMMRALAIGLPEMRFALDVPSVLMLATFHDARHVWGTHPAPPPPVGNSFAKEWAAAARVQRAARTVTPDQGPGTLARLVADFQLARRVCQIAGLPVPAMLDLPGPISDLYTARNAGLDYLPDVGFAADMSGMTWAVLDQLAEGQDVATVAAAVSSFLFGQ